MSEDLPLDELRGSVREVLTDRQAGAIVIPDDNGRGLDRALWAKMAALGWLALSIAEQDGGLGLGHEHLAVLYEELGRETASVPILSTMLVAEALARHGSSAARTRWLPAIATGECLAAIALADHPEPTCRREPGKISGYLPSVLFADVADVLAVPVTEADGSCCLALVERDTPGLSLQPMPLIDLTRSMADVRLDGVPEDAVEWLRPGNAGWTALLDHATLGLACDAVGGAGSLFESTADYLTIREQFGRPIGSFQALKHRMADWKVRLDATRVLTRHGAALLASGAPNASASASGAKAYACDVFAAFAADAVQLHGGIGFTWEHPCHLYLKRAKLSQQLFGDSRLHRERVAALAFG